MNTDIFEARESDIRGYCRAYPTVFTKASNARQWDEAGKSYIDFFAGAGVLNFGHNNAQMKQKLIDYLQNDGVVQSLDMYTVAKRDFLEMFVKTVLEPRGMPHKIQFVGPTGTNAVEAALKMARRVTGRPHVVAFSHGFHGMTLGSLACTANDYFRNAAGVPLEHVVRIPFETAPGGGMEAIAAYRAALADSSSGLKPPAGFLVEPLQAEGGVNVASAEWLQAVQQLARDNDALFILDDIQAGCGRTGSYFSFDGMGLDPDVINLAKGIGGYGTPLAMNLIKPEHDKHWAPGEHTGTFRGQGLSFVAGLEALRLLDDKSFRDATITKGQTMRRILDALGSKYGLAVRGKGLIQGIDMVDGSKSKAIAAECFKTGLLIGPCGSGGRVIKLIPPLTIPEEDLNEGLTLFTAAFDKIMGGN